MVVDLQTGLPHELAQKPGSDFFVARGVDGIEFDELTRQFDRVYGLWHGVSLIFISRTKIERFYSSASHTRISWSETFCR
jgi:hypothetical protein